MRRALLLSALAALAVAAVAVVLTRPEPRSVNEPVPASGAPPFDDDGRIGAGAIRAVYDQGGARLAVLTPEGVAVARSGALQPVPGTAEVVDLAWLQDGRHLLLADGGGRVGRLRVVDVTGTQTGVVPLGTALAFGHGLAVDARGRVAVAAVEARTGVGERHVHLVRIDLRSGEVAQLTSPDGADETGPHLLDGAVAYTVEGQRPRPVRLRLGGGEPEDLGRSGRVIGVSRGSVAVAAATNGTTEVRLGAGTVRLEPGEVALAANPRSPILVVRGPDGRLRRHVVG